MYTYVFTYIHMYIHIYVYTYMHGIYMHIWNIEDVEPRTVVRGSKYTYMHTYTYTYIDIHTHICTYIHLYIHMYVFTYIHVTYMPVWYVESIEQPAVVGGSRKTYIHELYFYIHDTCLYLALQSLRTVNQVPSGLSPQSMLHVYIHA